DRSIAPLVLHVQRAAAVGLQGRYPGLGTARERRAPGGTQLQAPPPARRLVVRRRGAERAGGYRPGGTPHAECAHDAPATRRGTRRRERALLAGRWLRRRRTRGGVCGAPARRLLLQDLPVPDPALVGARQPAHGGPGAGPRPA